MAKDAAGQAIRGRTSACFEIRMRSLDLTLEVLGTTGDSQWTGCRCVKKAVSRT